MKHSSGKPPVVGTKTCIVVLLGNSFFFHYFIVCIIVARIAVVCLFCHSFSNTTEFRTCITFPLSSFFVGISVSSSYNISTRLTRFDTHFFASIFLANVSNSR